MREEGPGVGPFARESSDVPRLSFDPPFEILETTTRQALDDNNLRRRRGPFPSTLGTARAMVPRPESATIH